MPKHELPTGYNKGWIFISPPLDSRLGIVQPTSRYIFALASHLYASKLCCTLTRNIPVWCRHVCPHDLCGWLESPVKMFCAGQVAGVFLVPPSGPGPRQKLATPSTTILARFPVLGVNVPRSFPIHSRGTEGRLCFKRNADSSFCRSNVPARTS